MLHQEKLSVCMIIKNEEKYLAKCLDAIKDHVDEIIIVDTGSTDKSKEIAKNYTGKIYDFIWSNDFSKARNFSISKCENNWVLVLDADEIVTGFDKKEIAQFMSLFSKQKIVGRVKIINFFEEESEMKKSITYVSRLFNKKMFHYEGTIHEQIVTKDKSQYHMEPVQITVEHLGYLNDVMNEKNKFQRNIFLLKNAIKERPDDSYYYYQLGKSYYKVEQYKDALKSFKSAIERCESFRYEYAEDLIESYGYALLKCGKYAEAMELQNYQKYYGGLPDYNFVMGLIYMNNGKFQEAINTFQKCIGENEGKIEGVNSYQPNYNIGVIYETLGYISKAIEFYQKCGKYLRARKRLNEIMKQKVQEDYEQLKKSIKKLVNENRLDEAQKWLDQYRNIMKDDIDIYSIQAVIAMMKGNMNEGEEILLEGLKKDEDDFNLLYNLAYIYHFTDRTEWAILYYKKAFKNANNKADMDEIYKILRSLEK